MSAEHFDEWYAAMAPASARDRLWQQHLGLPPELVSSSLLSLDGLREIGELLALEPGQVLLDLACGRGGYGMWLARETGCDVVGVDFSQVAVEDARRRVDDFGLQGRASYQVGDLAANGLPDRSVDAAVCVDAIQFAEDTVAACADTLRALRPGGTAVFTSWEGLDRDDEATPARIRDLDLASALTAAGFVEVQVLDRPDWLEREQTFWSAVLQIEPGDDRALQDAREEAEEIASVMMPRWHRVMATGRAPR